MGLDSERLDGWKQIAAHLDRSIKTAQNWERELGLPVRRVPGSTGRPGVFAFRSELDEWMRSGTYAGERDARSESTAPGTDAAARRTTSGRRLAATAIAALMLIAAAILTAPLWPDPVVEGVVVESDLIFAAIGPDGQRLWTHIEEQPFSTAFGDTPAARAVDLDGDGVNEVLFAIKRRNPGDDRVRALDARGNLLWEQPIGLADLTIDGTHYRDVYGLWDVLVLDTTAGRVIAAISQHKPWFPSLVQWIDAASGELLGTYVHTGHLFSSVATDLDADGSEELLTGGYNNLLEAPVVAVLEPTIGVVLSPGPADAHYRPRPERHYLRLYRSLTARSLGTASWVRRVELHGDLLRADVHLEGDDEREERIYLLDPADLSPVRVELPRSFAAYHRELLLGGAVSHDLAEEEANALRFEMLAREAHGASDADSAGGSDGGPRH